MVFTEHGAIMAATILNSPTAVEMSVLVVRAFVKLRQMLASSAALTHRLEALERSVATLDANTRQEFVRVYQAILKLMGPASSEQLSLMLQFATSNQCHIGWGCFPLDG
jgi:hypothetical protein